MLQKVQGLEFNIIKYSLYKIFTKRVHLPLIAIFLTTVGGLSLVQIATIASAASFAQLALEIPAGYISDIVGHKKSLVAGSFLCAISVLFYILQPNFFGGLVAAILFFGGCAFTSGTIQAFMHNTLIDLGRHSEYSKIMGRAQSFGLIGNIFLVSLVPLTYAINPFLPFWIGFVCLSFAFFLVLVFKTPESETIHKLSDESFLYFIKSVPYKQVGVLALVFLIYAVASSAFDQAGLFREIIYKDLGIPVPYFGFLIALGSLAAAIAGRYIYLLKNLTPKQFYLFDIAYVVIALTLVGISRNPYVIILAFILFPAYDRTRDIIYESQIFEEFHNSKNKSTIISIMNFSSLAQSIWSPIVLSAAVGGYGLYHGYILFGCVMGIIALMLLIGHNIVAKRI